MIVRLQTTDVRQNPVEVRQTQIVVIKDDFDQPLAVFVHANDGIWSSTIQDPDFQQKIGELGLVKRKAEVATPDVAVTLLNPPRGSEQST